MWGYVIAVTFFVAVFGILVYFGVRYWIERTQMQRGMSRVPSDDKHVARDPTAPDHERGGASKSAYDPDVKDVRFIDESEELPTYDQATDRRAP